MLKTTATVHAHDEENITVELTVPTSFFSEHQELKEGDTIPLWINTHELVSANPKEVLNELLARAVEDNA